MANDLAKRLFLLRIASNIAKLPKLLSKS